MIEENKDKEMSEEAEFYQRMVEAAFDFKKDKKDKKYRAEITAPKIEDGKVVITIRLPIEFLKKYAGDWNKDGVAQ